VLFAVAGVAAAGGSPLKLSENTPQRNEFAASSFPLFLAGTHRRALMVV
jgi:hypothetical protein